MGEWTVQTLARFRYRNPLARLGNALENGQYQPLQSKEENGNFKKVIQCVFSCPCRAKEHVDSYSGG